MSLPVEALLRDERTMNAFRRLLTVLLVAAAVSLAGCGDFGGTPNVVGAGGSSADFSVPGTVTVGGSLVNIGDGRAKDVRMTFKFFDGGDFVLETSALLSDIRVGESAQYSFTYNIPKANSYSFEIFWND